MFGAKLVEHTTYLWLLSWYELSGGLEVTEPTFVGEPSISTLAAAWIALQVMGLHGLAASWAHFLLAIVRFQGCGADMWGHVHLFVVRIWFLGRSRFGASCYNPTPAHATLGWAVHCQALLCVVHVWLCITNTPKTLWTEA